MLQFRFRIAIGLVWFSLLLNMLQFKFRIAIGLVWFSLLLNMLQFRSRIVIGLVWFSLLLNMLPFRSRIANFFFDLRLGFTYSIKNSIYYTTKNKLSDVFK